MVIVIHTGNKKHIGNKLQAIRTEYNGTVYHSKKEAEYARHLQYLKHAHNIAERVVYIQEQVPYKISLKNQYIATYFLDFKVEYGDGRIEYIDVKGYKKGCTYELFKLKKKLVEAQYGIVITEM